MFDTYNIHMHHIMPLNINQSNTHTLLLLPLRSSDAQIIRKNMCFNKRFPPLECLFLLLLLLSTHLFWRLSPCSPFLVYVCFVHFPSTLYKYLTFQIIVYLWRIMRGEGTFENTGIVDGKLNWLFSVSFFVDALERRDSNWILSVNHIEATPIVLHLNVYMMINDYNNEKENTANTTKIAKTIIVLIWYNIDGKIDQNTQT